MTTAPEALPPVSDLVPHGPPMRLIDRILRADPTTMTAEVRITRDSLFFVPGRGVASYAGVEYIAQTVSAHASWRERQADPAARPRIGFLLGSRQIAPAVSWFPEGAVLEVRVEEQFQDGSMGVFDGEIRCDGALLLKASINVYLPPSEDAALPGKDIP